MDQNIVTVIDGLFAGSTTSYPTANGHDVKFLRVNLSRIGIVTGMLDKLASSDLAGRLKEFLNGDAAEQAALMVQGESPNAIDFKQGVLLKKAFAEHSLLLAIFGSVAESLPGFVAALATISEAEYNELELDDQLVIAAGVIAVNYAFFTQSLPPIIASVMKGVSVRQQAGKQKVTATK